MVVGRVEGLGDFLGDHVLFALDLAGLEDRMEDQIGDDLQGSFEAIRHGTDLEHGALIAGRGIDRAAAALDALDDLARRHLARPLEHHMLEEVGPARLFRAFVTRPCGNGHTDRHGLEPGDGITDDADAIGEGVKAKGQDVSFRRRRTR